MPVTHGVTGSSPVRTAKALPLLIGVAGDFFITCPELRAY